MRQFHRTNPHITLFVVTSIIVAFLGLIITRRKTTCCAFNNNINGFSLFSLNLSSPLSSSFSSWLWPSSTSNILSAPPSSFAGAAVSLFGIHNYSSSPPNPNTTFYPSFNNEKIQRAVNELIKELNTESELRKGKLRDEKLEKIEADLGKARALIRDTAFNQSRSFPFPSKDANYVPHGNIYNNPYMFHRSYTLMERMFKVYVYEEGEAPLFHYGPCKNIYSIEGIFLSFMESYTRLRTRDADEAHVYFLPFSVVMILDHLFEPIIHDKAVLGRIIGDYVRVISTTYPYWNRSLGADHFMLSCHDWGPRATWFVHKLYFNSIRVLCNANTSEFFNPRKDASIPEINLPTGSIAGLTGGLPPFNRTILAFFAGKLHGKIRPVLFEYWKEKDKDIHVYETFPQGESYEKMMKKSKYCICPSGHEVASPRIVEALYAECVPVLISQHYILPFSDILNWDAFSVKISVSEIPNLKEILMGISEEKYLTMYENVKQVQKHFIVNDSPRRYDVFHMIMHSVWLRRLNLRVNG